MNIWKFQSINISSFSPLNSHIHCSREKRLHDMPTYFFLSWAFDIFQTVTKSVSSSKKSMLFVYKVSDVIKEEESETWEVNLQGVATKTEEISTPQSIVLDFHFHCNKNPLKAFLLTQIELPLSSKKPVKFRLLTSSIAWLATFS